MKTSTVTFIKSPYEHGVSVREDIAKNIFKIVAHGRMTYNEVCMYGMSPITMGETLEVTKISDITSAVLIAEYLYNNNAWEFRDNTIDYADEDGAYENEYGGPQSFSFQFLEILDRHGKRVMSASTNYKAKKLVWDVCIISEMRKNAAQAELDILRNKAAEERRAECFDDARCLETKREILMSRFVTSGYDRAKILKELERSSMMKPQALKQLLTLALAKSSLTGEKLPF